MMVYEYLQIFLSLCPCPSVNLLSHAWLFNTRFNTVNSMSNEHCGLILGQLIHLRMTL